MDVDAIGQRPTVWSDLETFCQPFFFFKEILFIYLTEREPESTRRWNSWQPGWPSGLAPAVSPGPDPGDQELSPTWGSLRGACFFLCLCLCLCVCLS